MGRRYEGVVCRGLMATERRVPVGEERIPIVIAPSTSSRMDFLTEFLTDNSAQLIEDISEYGAVLFRGFEVETPISFEQTILSIQGMCGMNGILFQLPGRTAVVGGCEYVVHTSVTSRLEKTGGTLSFMLFHTENYGFPDVPAYMAFYCETPSRLGGETGLVDFSKVYSDLPTDLKQKLEERACIVELHAVEGMAERYCISDDVISEFCDRVALPIITVNGAKYVAIYKPSVIRHPLTKEHALAVNLYWLQAVRNPLINAFKRDYSGGQWYFHRLSWKASRNGLFSRKTGRRSKAKAREVYVFDQSPIPGACSLASLFSGDEVQVLAAAIRHRYSSFLWKKGDILVVDNLKVAHSGMPGLGNRELKLMMCNPVRLPCSAGPGLYVIPNGPHPQECLGKTLRFYRAQTNTIHMPSAQIGA